MAPMDLPAPFRPHGDHIAADLPGGTVLFSTRRGGVSEGPFASLNLGRLTDDSDANVDANRERLAAAAGHARERFLYGRQVHGASVRRATEPPGPSRPRGRGGRPGDGARRCRRARLHGRLPAGDARRRRRRRGAARRLARPGGRDRGRGCRGAARARRDGPVAAALGPAARGCCYEVGEEVHARFEAYDARVGERNLDLPAVARAQLEAAGAAEVHDVGLCTMCGDPELFFSHRRDRGVTGRQAGVVWRA